MAITQPPEDVRPITTDPDFQVPDSRQDKITAIKEIILRLHGKSSDLRGIHEEYIVYATYRDVVRPLLIDHHRLELVVGSLVNELQTELDDQEAPANPPPQDPPSEGGGT